MRDFFLPLCVPPDDTAPMRYLLKASLARDELADLLLSQQEIDGIR